MNFNHTLIIARLFKSMVLDVELVYVTFIPSLTLKEYVWNSVNMDFCSKLKNNVFLFDSEIFLI